MRGPGAAVATAALGYVALQGTKTALALRTARRVPTGREPDPDEVRRVVVLQPVLAGDPDLEDALRDNLLSMPRARFVWLVDDDDPEARAVTARLREQAARSGPDAPRVEVVSCAPAPEGVNPKLVKLQQALAGCADDEVVLVLDDDTRLPAASLGALLDGLEGTGGRPPATVATGLPGYLPGTSVWARAVEQFVVANAATTYLTLPPVTLNGMTWAARVGDLRALGGFTPVLGHLTDDLAVARLVLDAGGTICQTAAPQWTRTTVESGARYVALMHRWMLFATLLLRRQPPRTAGAIALLHGVHPTLLAAVLLDAVRRRRPGTAAAVLLARAALLRLVQRRLHGRALDRPLLSVAVELAQPLHLVHGATRRTITWRTRRYRVRADDDFAPA